MDKYHKKKKEKKRKKGETGSQKNPTPAGTFVCSEFSCLLGV